MNEKIKAKRIFLIEGPDNTGKTTLCKEFEKEGYIYYHHSAPKKGEVEKYFTDFYNVLLKHFENGDRVVIDRLFITNFVYSKTYKNTEVISWQLIQKYKKIIGNLIICLPQDHVKYFEEYYKNKNIRGDEFSDIEKVYWSFKRILFNREHPLRDKFRTTNYDKYFMKKEDISRYVKKNCGKIWL